MLAKFKTAPQLLVRQPDLKPGETLCDHCDAKCCNSVSIEIDAPETKEDFEWLKYYTLHTNVYVAVDVTGAWEVVFVTPCKYLDGNRCSIYDDTRPKPCKDHKPPYCDYNISPGRYVRFDTPEQIDAYCTLKETQNGTV